MSVYVGTVASGPSASLVLDKQSLVNRIANLLRRNDINAEIEQWLNFVQRDMAKEVKFSSLRVGFEAALVSMPVAPVADSTLYYYLDLPQDYSTADRIFYKNTTDANNVWGLNLVPLPRKFYAGDTVDFERLLNVSSPAIGDPMYYWIEGLRVGYYPALADGLTGKFQFWYYKLPTDMINATDEPAVPAALRHYMILLAIAWGKILQAQSASEIPIIAYWEKRYKTIMNSIKGMQHETETPREKIEPPETGMEMADGVY